MTSQNLRLSHGLAYASPIFITMFLHYPVQLLLAGIYAKYFGLALTTIASIVFAARLFDAVTDPLIGYLSDRVHAKTGTRKPWIVIGSLGIVVSSYFLYSPPTPVGASYFLLWYFAFYLFFTMVDIPHMAWGSELAVNSQDTTRIYSLRTQMLFLGGLFFVVAPLLPLFSGDEGFTPETLRWSVLASGIVVLPILMTCVIHTPNGRKSKAPKKDSLHLVITSVIENRPLLILLSGFFLVSISYGFYIGLLFILADSYLGIGKQLPLIFVVSGIAGLGAAFMVYHLSTYCKKLTIYIISILLTATALVGHAFLAPGPSVFVPLTLLVSMIYFGNAMVLIIVPSLLSDIVDYGTLKFGSDRAATYFSVYFFMVKALGGVGSACGLAIIAWYNFDASALTHNQESVFGLHLAIAYLPTLMLFVSLFLIVKTPINAHRHHIIQKRLTQRLQRQVIDLNTPVTNPSINT